MKNKPYLVIGIPTKEKISLSKNKKIYYIPINCYEDPIRSYIEFSRKQMIMFRKFILGQCSRIILNNNPYKQMGLSSKKLFDDTYLYFMEYTNKGTGPLE